MKGKGFQAKSNTPQALVNSLLPHPCAPLSPHTTAPGLTEGLHQLSLHAVGHQRFWELREEGLHGSCYCVDGEVLLHQVQIVVWGKKK